MVSAMALSACAPRIDNRGNQVHPEDVAAIEPGKWTRNQVLDRLGSPSSEGTFGEDTWYYIFERTETTAFLAPEVKERKVIEIQFDKAGVVKKVETLDKTNAKSVSLAPGETPTAGNSLNFIQQMLTNVGRFNKGKDTKK
jgi:outer membrane protein assembly factor BamE (lipoprotein component of BamABCDE complex)